MSAFDVLPQEILVRVFRYLDITDKKNVRLTCKQWYFECNELLFVKFVLKNNDFNLNSIIELITQSKLKRLNLEFYGKSAMNSFWNKCGPNIKSLHLKDCEMSENDLRGIITECQNIEHLCFEYCNIIYEVLPELLDALIDDAIRIESLISLKICVCPWFTNNVFNKFSILYPQISNTIINIMKPVSKKEEPETSDFEFDSLFNKIQTSAEILKCLDLNDMPNMNTFSDKELLDIASIPNLRLKKLCINNHDKITYCGFNAFALKQTELQHLDLSKSFDFTPECLLKSLTQCSNLRTLKIRCSKQYLCEILKLVATSYLTAFEIHQLEPENADNITLTDTKLENYRINSLRIDFHLSDEQYLWIIKVFRSLHCIDITSFGHLMVSFDNHDKVFQAITNYQTNLKKLELKSDERFDVCAQQLSQPSLKDLQYLILHDLGIHCKLNLPQLKHLEVLRLKTDDEDDDEDKDKKYNAFIKVFCENNPAIEYFDLGVDIMYSDVIDVIIKHLPKLRIFKYQIIFDACAWCLREKLGKDYVEKSFDFNHSLYINHPTLREVTLVEFNLIKWEENIYSRTYDIFTKKWSEKRIAVSKKHSELPCEF